VVISSLVQTATDRDLHAGSDPGTAKANLPELRSLMYHYRCDLERIIDGDTVVLVIQLGCHVSITRRCRLYGIDTPEVVGADRAAGLAAARRLDELTVDAELTCHTHLDKNDKYGRLLVDLHLDGVSLNQQLIDEGHAEPYPKR